MNSQNDKTILTLSWDKAPELLNVTEAAQIARVGKAQIYNLAHTDNFPAVRFGKIIRIPKDKFKEWLDGNF